jgi:O-methyltransferase
MTEPHEFKQRYLNLLKEALCASLYDESAWQRIDGPMRAFTSRFDPAARFKRAIIAALDKRALKLVRSVPFDGNLRRQGLDWPLFGYTMTGRERLDLLESCLNDVINNKVPGDIAETGVWRGGSMIFAAALLDVHGDTDRKIWLADSFEGMPVPTETDSNKSKDEDFSDRSYLAVTLDQVKANFARFGLLSDRLQFLKGWFCDTLPDAPIEKLALLRLDGDLYESTRDALNALYAKLSIGGYLIVDDYFSWPGCKLAVDEYRTAHAITDTVVKIDAHAIYWQRTR